MANIGLRQRILAASKVTEIEALLLEGKTFSKALAKTKRAWRNAAARRMTEIKAQA